MPGWRAGTEGPNTRWRARRASQCALEISLLNCLIAGGPSAQAVLQLGTVPGVPGRRGEGGEAGVGPAAAALLVQPQLQGGQARTHIKRQLVGIVYYNREVARVQSVELDQAEQGGHARGAGGGPGGPGRLPWGHQGAVQRLGAHVVHWV